jgi:hypothetical protein
MSTWGSEYSLHHRNVYYTEQLYRRQETELAINIRKATSIEEISPKRTSEPPTTRPPALI